MFSNKSLKYSLRDRNKWCHLEVLWRIERNQVGEKLEQEHQRLLAVGLIAAASTKRHLKREKYIKKFMFI